MRAVSLTDRDKFCHSSRQLENDRQWRSTGPGIVYKVNLLKYYVKYSKLSKKVGPGSQIDRDKFCHS